MSDSPTHSIPPPEEDIQTYDLISEREAMGYPAFEASHAAFSAVAAQAEPTRIATPS